MNALFKLPRISNLDNQCDCVKIVIKGFEKKFYIKPDHEFNSFGLRYNLFDLEKLSYSIILLPLEQMADYVDGVTKKAIDNNDTLFLLKQILYIKNEDIKNIDIQKLNAISIGNLAYIALNSFSEDAKNIAECILAHLFNSFFPTFKEMAIKQEAISIEEFILLEKYYYNYI